MIVAETYRAERIRALNDALRETGMGGRALMTASVAALAADVRQQVLEAVQRFDAFTADNDPYREHDCANLNVAGLSIIWKIDYFDQELSGHSPDPADPNQTRRVLTIMLAEDY